MKIVFLKNLALTGIAICSALVLPWSANAQAAPPPAGYSLIGTIRGRDFAGAVIKAGNDQTFYRLGEKLPDGSQIVKVQSDTILLKSAEGTVSELFILHDAGRAVPAIPFSTAPYAGAAWASPREQPLTAYEKRRLRRLGKRKNPGNGE